MLTMQLPEAELREFVKVVIGETLDRLAGERNAMSDRMAFNEPEAAQLIGVPRHVLRDARRRGEITASRVGKRCVYKRGNLEKYLASMETQK